MGNDSCINHHTRITVSPNTYLLNADSLDNGNGVTCDKKNSTHNNMSRSTCASNLGTFTVLKYSSLLVYRQP